MKYENRKYAILESSEINSIDFSKVMETSKNTLRYSLDKSQSFVKFEGITPSFLGNKTLYNYDEIVDVLNGENWVEEIDIE